MRVASLFLVTVLIACAGACGGKSKEPVQPEPEIVNTGGDEGGDTYGSTGGYEDDKEPCEEELE